jgi:tRNA-uridine 2-sulfurtransferase
MVKQKVIVAMSGGVDSSVAASVLIMQGYEVAGVSLRLWEPTHPRARDCSDYSEAGKVAEFLGIPHALLDARSAFAEGVVRPFAQSYLGGRTPNPCVACNRDFKLGLLLRFAQAQKADYVATGHYARIVLDSDSGPYLMRGVDRGKDQSYFLFDLSQEQLGATLFPLGGWRKEEVRSRARKFGLPVAERPDSQDICLGNYQSLVESYAEQYASAGGEIVDRQGRVLGTHRGIHGFTVGQRKGLGISAAGPLYVLELAPKSKRVVVGTRDELGSKGLVAHSVHWIEPPPAEEIEAEVQVRYRAPSICCRVLIDRNEKAEVYFRDETATVTPGQAAVFYRGERVLGGGWIEREIK